MRGMDEKSLRLYLVTDRSWLRGQTLEAQVEAVLQAGVTFLQLREKQLPPADFLAQAKGMRRLADRYGVPFVVNDNVQIALESGADGVHVGQQDMAAQDVRALIGPEKILGVSARTLEEAVAAQQAGADYLGVGAVFQTSTKLDARAVSFETLRQICQAVTIPVVAIGGITAQNIDQLRGSKIAGVAVVSAILAQPDPAEAARNLRTQVEKVVLG